MPTKIHMLRSHIARVVPVALTLVGCGLAISPASAQTTYSFEATYNSEITNTLLQQTETGIILKTNGTGESPDAPYGLTNLAIDNYTSVDFSTGVATYNSDPATFGLEGLPFGTLTLFGDGSDRLFGTNSGTAGLETGSGTITLIGGEGRFANAAGSLNLFQTITSNPDPTGVTAPIISPATISGSFTAPKPVPEPQTNATLIAIAAIGSGFLLRRHRTKVQHLAIR